MYSIRTAEREALVGWIDRGLDMEPPVTSLCIDRKVGRSTSQQGEMLAEELAILSSTGGAAAILDDIVERWGRNGGRWRLRLMIEAGEGEPKRQLVRSFDLVKLRPSETSKSAGSAKGVEELTTAFSDAFSLQVESQQEAQAATTQTMLAMLERSDKAALIRLQEATQYQAALDRLRQDNTELSIRLAMAEQQSVLTPELMQQALPVVLQFLAGVSRRWLGEAADPAGAVSAPSAAGAAAPLPTTADPTPAG